MLDTNLLMHRSIPMHTSAYGPLLESLLQEPTSCTFWEVLTREVHTCRGHVFKNLARTVRSTIAATLCALSTHTVAEAQTNKLQLCMRL